ncbi:MAG: pyridoxal phosphate-dependent aminotransferase [Oscillospiraceae bacterium]|nr:pyridoxal phosphate-dependent aminotransferase [Oscillospiraceae bacterium]
MSLPKGYFDSITDRRVTSSIKWEKENILPMWIADMDFRTAPCIIEYMKQRAEQGIFGYDDVTDGWYRAYTEHWKVRHGYEFSREEMIYSTGVIPTISAAVRKLSTPGEKVALLTPVYNIFFNCIRNNGRFPAEVPLICEDGAYAVDLELLEKTLSDPQVSLLLLCNPHNPGGKLYTAEELERIGGICKRNGVIVISDEIHCDITEPGESYVPFASVNETNSGICVTCISPTKAFNIAGINTSAAVVRDPVLRHRVWRELNTSECGEPGSFACGVTERAFSPEGLEWLDAMRTYVSDNRRLSVSFIEEQLPRLRVMPSLSTYLLWIDCKGTGMDGKRFAASLEEKTGLRLSSGDIYGSGGESFVRMNIACPRKLLDDGLERLSAYFR